jgi:hypothetical protein
LDGGQLRDELSTCCLVGRDEDSDNVDVYLGICLPLLDVENLGGVCCVGKKLPVQVFGLEVQSAVLSGAVLCCAVRPVCCPVLPCRQLVPRLLWLDALPLKFRPITVG